MPDHLTALCKSLKQSLSVLYVKVSETARENGERASAYAVASQQPMQKASFHTHFTHTHSLLSRGLPKHCKGTARPYSKITLPTLKMELLLGRDLLTYASNTHGSLDGRGKSQMKGYFPGNVPLFLQTWWQVAFQLKENTAGRTKPPFC